MSTGIVYQAVLRCLLQHEKLQKVVSLIVSYFSSSIFKKLWTRVSSSYSFLQIFTYLLLPSIKGAPQVMKLCLDFQRHVVPAAPINVNTRQFKIEMLFWNDPAFRSFKANVFSHTFSASKIISSNQIIHTAPAMNATKVILTYKLSTGIKSPERNGPISLILYLFFHRRRNVHS